MSSFGVSNIQGVNLQDKIPESAKLVANSIDVQSVVSNRRQVKFNANNGNSFSPSETIHVALQSQSDFIIPSSASVHLVLKNSTVTAAPASAASTTSCFDDLSTCVINRAMLSASGVAVEDILDVNKVINTLAYSHMTPEHYNNQASVNVGAWKWVKGYGSDGVGAYTPAPDTVPPTTAQVNASVASVNSYAVLNRNDTFGVASRQILRSAKETANGLEVNIPLSYIFALFRSNTLFPLSFLSSLDMHLTLESAIKAIFSTVGTDVPNYKINEFYVVADMVSLSTEYLNILQASFNASEEMGYTLPIQTISTAPQSSVAGGQSDMTFSKSTPFMKNIYFRFTDTTFDTKVDEYSISGQCYHLNASPNMRLRVGSKPFPEYDSLKSAHEIYRNNCVGLGQMSNVSDNLGLLNNNTLTNATSKGSQFYTLFSMEKISGLGADYYAMDSMDASLAGGVITLSANLLATTQILAMFEHTKVLKLGDRRVDVRG